MTFTTWKPGTFSSRLQDSYTKFSTPACNPQANTRKAAGWKLLFIAKMFNSYIHFNIKLELCGSIFFHFIWSLSHCRATVDTHGNVYGEDPQTEAPESRHQTSARNDVELTVEETHNSFRNREITGDGYPLNDSCESGRTQTHNL